jgi:N-methylhydantoinase A
VEVTSPLFGAGSSAPQQAATPTRTRRANLGRGFEDTRIYRGPDLRTGDTIDGPGIIEESYTTVVVYPGWRAHLDDAGDYVLRVTSSAA